MQMRWTVVETEHHVICGRHSGIPECCICWYIGSWQKTCDVPKLWETYWEANYEHAEPDYIRCPKCIASNHVVEIKRCACYKKRVKSE